MDPIHATAATDQYCIIGAGAAGLAAADVLLRDGFEVTVFEKTDRVGGHWHDDYESLHLITSRDVSGFEGFPMPSHLPVFPSREQIVEYMNDFAKERDLCNVIQFNTEVLFAEPNGDGTWSVTTSTGESLIFKAVLVANGHLWSPKLPDIAAEFTGHSLHSHHYANLEDVEGDRILIVGAGNSGCDLAVESAQERLDTTISMRHGHAFLPKTIFGKARAELHFINKLPAALRDRILRVLVNVVLGKPSQYKGLVDPTSASFDSQPPVVNNLLLYWIQHGRITAAPGISSINGKEVTFMDGQSREFDTILWATGFRVKLPFLRDELLTWRDGVPARTGGLTIPAPAAGENNDGLYFIGLAAPRGPQWPVYSRQARLVSRLLALRDRGLDNAGDRLMDVQGSDCRVDIVRSVWVGQMNSAEREVERWKKTHIRPSLGERVPARV